MKCLKVVSTPMSASTTKPSREPLRATGGMLSWSGVPTMRTGSTPASGKGSRVREISAESTASRRVRVPAIRAPGGTANRINTRGAVGRRDRWGSCRGLF